MPDVVAPPTVSIDRASTRRSAGRAATPVRLDSVQERLYAVLQNTDDPDEALAEFCWIAAELTGAECAVYFHGDQAGALTPGPEIDVTRLVRDVVPQATARICAAAVEGRPKLICTEDGLALIAVPVSVPEPGRAPPDWPTRREVICVALPLRDGPLEPVVISLQMIAAHITQWYERQANKKLDWEAEATAAIVDIVGAIENSPDQKAGCFAIAGKLRQVLGCDKVIVGLLQPSGRMAVRAISDVARFDPRGEIVRLHETALNEAVVRDAVTSWPAESDDRHTMLAHRKLTENLRATFVTSIPLRTLGDEPIGAVTVVGDTNARSQTEAMHLLQAAGPYWGNALHLVQRARGGPLARLTRGFVANRGWRIKMLAAISLVVAAILAVPASHKIGCDCVLQPSARRYVVAPYDGVLKESLVKPGELVTADQTLALMDDREIQWELSGLLADRDRAAKQRDASLSQRDIPAAQMAQFEVERLALKIQLARHRRDSLEILSSIDGVVIDGDLDDARGAPVKIGQPLFEIAPLDRLRLEVSVPEEDIPYVREGMPVIVTFDGDPYEAVEGQIDRIRPQTELRDEKNVFVAEILMENADRRLRPGMQGRAKVLGGRRMLGWILFHRAWEKAVSSLR
jgi:hypothetical protein